MDLTEVGQRLNEQLIVDPDMFRQILDLLPDGLLVVNEAGEIQFVNQQIELLFGYSRLALKSQPVHMLLDPKLREIHAKHIDQFFTHPSVRPMNLAKALPGRHRSGRLITVAINLSPIVSDQGVLALALVRRVVDGYQNQS